MTWIRPCQHIVRNGRDGYTEKMKHMRISVGPDPTISWHLRRMGHILERHNANLSKALRGLGLNAPMWRLLNGLREIEGATISDLAKHSAFERSYVSRIVMRMEGMGLISTRSDELDSRIKVIQMTSAGLKRYNEAAGVVRKVNNDTTRGFSAAEDAKLQELLDRLAVNVGANNIF